MRAKIIFKGVANYDSLILKSRFLSDHFSGMLKTLEVNSLVKYFDYILDSEEFNVLPVNYQVVKNFNVDDFFCFSSSEKDWENDKENWLIVEKNVRKFFMVDIIAQVVKKQLKGNILELEVVVINIDNLLSFE